MKKIKICIVSGSRAEYGLLFWLMKNIDNDPKFQLQIIVTGMHLSPEYGLTYKEILQDGFTIDRKIEMLLSSDTSSSISKSTGLGIIGFTDAFKELNPDMIIVLGDRYEIFASCISSLFLKIPIAHIHGGETTTGASDEAIRHSITKIAWWHFVATDEYKKRVMQLGEHPDRIFTVGGLGVDAIKKLNLLTKAELSKTLRLSFNKKNLLITYHPVTLEDNTSQLQIKNLLEALDELNDTYLIFTMPNSDTDNKVISKMINKFVDNNKNSILFISMGHLNYLSTLQFVDAVVGNSSSGLAEAPTFKIGTINIGDRQKGRLKSASVIDCNPIKQSILKAIRKLYTEEFQNDLLSCSNPYGMGNASDLIINKLNNISIPKELKKKFYDL